MHAGEAGNRAVPHAEGVHFNAARQGGVAETGNVTNRSLPVDELVSTPCVLGWRNCKSRQRAHPGQ
jgi:hypothetical protein